MRDPRLIKSAVHVAQLMAAFESPGEVLSQRELIRRTGLSRGIMHRLLYTLEPHGIVEKQGNDQYRLTYRRVLKNKWKIGYGAPGVDTRFVRQVTEGLQIAAERSGEVNLLVRDHRYKASVTLRDAERFIHERVQLVIEYQLDEHVGPMIAARYRDANIPMVAVNYPHPGATYFGANNYAAGLIGGRHLGKWARNAWKGEVDGVLMLGRSRSGVVPNARLTGIVQGIRETLGAAAEHLPVVYLDGDGVFEASWEVTRKHLCTSQKGKVLIGAISDDGALGALRAYEEVGALKQCAVIGQNGSPEARQELRRAGTRLIGTVAYFPETYGEGLVSLALDILNRRLVPPALFTKHQLLTTQTVDHVYPNDAIVDFAPAT
jgi:ribose transport system substrate-binding protein